MEKTQRADPAPYVLGLVVSISGAVGLVIGLAYACSPIPNEDWIGPASCIVAHARPQWGNHDNCPQAPWSVRRNTAPLVAAPLVDTHHNCTICLYDVACGAPPVEWSNLVDGTMQILAYNATKPQCMKAGATFSGYYLPVQNGAVEVQLETTVHKARASHHLRRSIAPYLMGTGSFALIGSVIYAIYACVMAGRELGRDQEAEPSHVECWPFGGSPEWGCKYGQVQNGPKGDYDGAGICAVCLTAPSGDVHFVGCGHAVVCAMCAGLLRHCPVCSQRIDGIRIDSQCMIDTML